jgi:hypothetical protein
LADTDIETPNSLVGTINDQMTQLRRQQSVVQTQQSLMRQLGAQRQQHQQTLLELNKMYDEAFNRLTELRSTAVFYTYAEKFWGEMDVALSIRVQGAQENLVLLASMLDKELTLTDFEAVFHPEAKTLREALIEFASSVDKKTNLLLESDTDYCGGPPRTAGGTNISQKCNIESITRYYEIVDPVTCTFRYLNPPGCPPPSKTVSVSAQAVTQGKARGTWVRETDQNWIGRNRCTSSQAIYYGKTPSPDACEQICISDPTCRFWTYNVRNGYMPRSTQECWGAGAALSPNTDKWEGFASGGVRDLTQAPGGTQVNPLYNKTVNNPLYKPN